VADRDGPLRADVRMLGDWLGRVLVEQVGDDLLADVERIRALARRLRERGGEPERAGLGAAVRRLPLDRQAEVLRAFGLYFGLANVAEQHHRLRRRRAQAREAAPLRESLAEYGLPGLALRNLEAALAATVLAAFPAGPGVEPAGRRRRDP
jgi:phosphoenolpyruvate carboxylase